MGSIPVIRDVAKKTDSSRYAMPALRFQTCRLLSGNVRKRELTFTGLCIIKVTLESPGQAQIAPFTIFRFPCWSHHVRYPYDATTKKMISDWSLRESDSLLRDMSTDSDVLASNSRAPGRLAFSTSSGASNMRIKAICNYVIQRLLRLVHDFNILL